MFARSEQRNTKTERWNQNLRLFRSKNYFKSLEFNILNCNIELAYCT